MLGIEAINCYVGRAYIQVEDVFRARGLSMERMQNLMMISKSVNLPIEDPVTNAVNAAKPLIDRLSPEEVAKIEIIIVGSESGLDFGKPNSTYIAHYLGLPRNCRSFEVKHACYGGTAALQSAVAMIGMNPRPGVKALVIAADASSVAARDTYWEPSQGAGAVAMIVSDKPEILALDIGANGYYSYEVMDTLRPRADLESGDSDLSILSYIKCLDESFGHYCRIVEGADFESSFGHLAFHSPFAGLVKSAHKKIMMKYCRSNSTDIELDFENRLSASLKLCQNVGNVYSAALYLGLCSILEYSEVQRSSRIGLFSYGSGCASEFYSGAISPISQEIFRELGTSAQLNSRLSLDWDFYEWISDQCLERIAGVENLKPNTSSYDSILASRFSGLLVLDEISRFHRQYRFV